VIDQKNRLDSERVVVKQMDVIRPLIKYYWPALAELATTNWSDVAQLQTILAELLFRKRPGAMRLRKKIADRLIELSRESFIWPDTSVIPSRRALKGDQFWYTKGILSFMGYKVGYAGVPPSHRRDILDYVYSEDLPRVNSPDYMKEWATPRSRQRLKKLANTLASLTRNAKRNQAADMGNAVADWESDLTYLKRTYYDGRYQFVWPDTYVI
jgi:hypothetical protein